MPWHWLMLVAHTVIAISLAVLATVTLMDSLATRSLLGDEAARKLRGTAEVQVVGRVAATTSGSPCCLSPLLSMPEFKAIEHLTEAWRFISQQL